MPVPSTVNEIFLGIERAARRQRDVRPNVTGDLWSSFVFGWLQDRVQGRADFGSLDAIEILPKLQEAVDRELYLRIDEDDATDELLRWFKKINASQLCVQAAIRFTTTDGTSYTSPHNQNFIEAFGEQR